MTVRLWVEGKKSMVLWVVLSVCLCAAEGENGNDAMTCGLRKVHQRVARKMPNFFHSCLKNIKPKVRDKGRVQASVSLRMAGEEWEYMEGVSQLSAVDLLCVFGESSFWANGHKGWGQVLAHMDVLHTQDLEDLESDQQPVAKAFFLANKSRFSRGWCKSFDMLLEFSENIIVGATPQQKAFLRLGLYLLMGDDSRSAGCFFNRYNVPTCLSEKLQKLMDYFISDGDSYVFAYRQYDFLKVVCKGRQCIDKKIPIRFISYLEGLCALAQGKMLISFPEQLGNRDHSLCGRVLGLFDTFLEELEACHRVNKNRLIVDSINHDLYAKLAEGFLQGIKENWYREGVERIVVASALFLEGNVYMPGMFQSPSLDMPRCVEFRHKEFSLSKINIIEKVLRISLPQESNVLMYCADQYMSEVYVNALIWPLEAYQTEKKAMLQTGWGLGTIAEDCEGYHRVMSATADYLCQEVCCLPEHKDILMQVFNTKIDIRMAQWVPLYGSCKPIESRVGDGWVVGVYFRYVLEAMSPIEKRQVLARMVQTREILVGGRSTFFDPFPHNDGFFNELVDAALSLGFWRLLLV